MRQGDEVASVGAGYVLGVDLGTTFTAAAISRAGRTEIVPLGDHAPQIPSAVFLTEAGEYLIGDAAIRRGIVEPGRLAKEFKRRLGDDTSMILGASPVSAQALMAQLLAWVVRHVTAGQGEAPSSVVITHPANWGPYRLELLNQAAHMAAVPHARLCPEPEAAALHFASTERVQAGQTVAVYDLGGGTFDAAVLRKSSADGFTVLGSPEGIEHLGGLDFDAAVLHHVQESIGTLDIDPDDPATLTALTRLARDCTEAKEALSIDNDVTIPVTVSLTQTVRLSRPEFEEAIRPALEQTLSAVQRTLDSADVTAEDVSSIVLIGGSSRIPLVSHLLTDEFNRPIALSAQPKHAVALGATLAARDNATGHPALVVADTTQDAQKPGRKVPILIGAAALALIAVIALLLTTVFQGPGPTAAEQNPPDSPADPVAATTEAPEPVTLTMAHYGDSDYAPLLAAYRVLHPHVTVDLLGADESGGGGAAVRDRLLAGESRADIETVSANYLPELRQEGDVFEDMSSPEVEGRWWKGTTQDGTTADGKLIGYGTHLGPMAVCYRADLLADSGMPTAPDAVADLLGDSWDDYFEAGKRFVAASDAAWYDSSGGVLDGMVGQRETAYEDTDGRVIVDGDGDLRALYDGILTASVSSDLSAGLHRGGKEWSASLQRDDYATVLCPSGSLKKIQEGSTGVGEWNIAPTFPGGAGGYRGGFYLTVPSSTRYPEEAVALAGWLTEPEQQVEIFTSSGHFPSQVEAWESDPLRSVTNPYFDDAPVGEIYAEQAKKLADPPYRGQRYLEIHNLLKTAIYRVDIDGTDSPDESWEKFLAEVSALE